MASGRLEGKVAIVVGAGSVAPGWSNGKACAVAYAREGAAVVCVDYQLARARETAGIIEREGGRALALQADATREEDLQAVMSETVAQFKRLDILHNNVGIGGASGAPDKIPPEMWNREIAQNLTTAYLGIRCAVPLLRNSGGGAITNTSSLLAVRFLARPNVAYTAAKAAVEAMTRACAAAYGRDNIRVNCLRIGFSETPIVQLTLDAKKLTDEERQQALDRTRAKVPLRGEHGDPFDVAATAVFLASDEAKHITGVVLGVDGGLECAPI
jgi:NAD(P)-dependent dehydrogenase (short-subunit alcohol dehydrogenase family)